MVVKEQVLELRHHSLVDALFLEVGLGLELLEINLTTKSISVSECHFILILVIIRNDKLACSVGANELEILC